MNSSAIWEIIALSHAFEEMLLHEAKPSAIYSSNAWQVQLFPKIEQEFM